jgi:hypothetical protein
VSHLSPALMKQSFVSLFIPVCSKNTHHSGLLVRPRWRNE